jgi:asparagine synthetase B (glutamine-hydrolysing)
MIQSIHDSILVVHAELLNGNLKEYYKLNNNFYSKNEPTVFGNSKILFVGVLYNLEELKIKYNCHIENILEMIGCLYNKHGKKFLDSLDGSFSLVIAQNNNIIMLRDYFGLESLYYFSVNSNIKIISNSISEIKKYVRLSINEDF